MSFLKQVMIVLLFFNTIVFTQDDVTFYSSTFDIETAAPYWQTGVPGYDSVEYYCPIQFHIVCYNNGTGGYSGSNLDSAVEYLNSYFSNWNIYFFDLGNHDYIYSDRYAALDLSDVDNLRQINNILGVINIYIVPLFSQLRVIPVTRLTL